MHTRLWRVRDSHGIVVIFICCLVLMKERRFLAGDIVKGDIAVTLRFDWNSFSPFVSRCRRMCSYHRKPAQSATL